MPTEGNFDFNPDFGSDPTVSRFKADKMAEMEMKLKAKEEINAFRSKIEDLSKALSHSHLNGINVNNLNAEDMVFFRLFEKGKLPKTQIENQLKLLRAPGVFEQTGDSRKLFNYMLIETLARQRHRENKAKNKPEQIDLDL